MPADFGAPVAAGVNVDPNKGLETLGSLMGLTQRKQALAGQAADVQVKQQDAEQRAAMSQVDWSKHMGSDGTIDLNSFNQDQGIRKAAGDYYPDVLAKAAAIKQAQTGAKQSLLSLNSDQVGKFAQTMGGLQSDPDVQKDTPAGRQKVQNAYQGFQQTFGPDAAKAVAPYQGAIQNAPQGKLASVLQHIQLQGMSAQSQIDETKPSTATIDTGAQVQPGAVSSPLSATPGAFTPSGPAVRKELGPTDQPGYRRQVAAATTEGGAGASNDEALYNDIVQKGTKATQVKSLSQDIQNLAHEVQTGQYSKAFADKWSAFKQTFGFKPGDDSAETKRQILSKMAAQLKVQSEAGASTDSERAGVEAALPDPEHMGPAAVAQAARYVGAQSDVSAARAANANLHRQVHGGASTGLRQADSGFMTNADPRIFEAQSVPAGPERQAYYKSRFKNAEDAKAFAAKVEAMKAYGAIK